MRSPPPSDPIPPPPVAIWWTPRNYDLEALHIPSRDLAVARLGKGAGESRVGSCSRPPNMLHERACRRVPPNGTYVLISAASCPLWSGVCDSGRGLVRLLARFLVVLPFEVDDDGPKSEVRYHSRR